MIDLYSAVKDTNVYKTILGEKRAQKLSHAYLIITADKEFLPEYLKIFAKLICCEKDEPCGNCRACRLIENGAYSDVLTYPVKGDVVLTEDVSALIEESYLKPIENEKKVFIINHAETMNGVAQNKLLKTLEEPPANVHILIGSTSEFPILSTIKSRVKKFEIPFFSKEKITCALKEECPDSERLKIAVSAGDGTVGKALALYEDETLSEIMDVCADTLCNMKSSADVLKYSTKITCKTEDVSQFLSVLELGLRDLLCYYQGKENLIADENFFNKIKYASGFNTGSVLYALEKITEAEKRLKFNANATMLTEWLLFQILEGRYKWQKL